MSEGLLKKLRRVLRRDVVHCSIAGWLGVIEAEYDSRNFRLKPIRAGKRGKTRYALPQAYVRQGARHFVLEKREGRWLLRYRRSVLR